MSDLPTFRGSEPRIVQGRLEAFVPDASPEQRRSWQGWIPRLQREATDLLQSHEAAKTYTAILEYRLPRDFRRPDVIVLEHGVVVVLELKGHPAASHAGLDQVSAYARDLRAYHAHCHDRPVVPVLVPGGASVIPEKVGDVWVVGPRGIHGLLEQIAGSLSASPVSAEAFIRDDVYAPLPTIVQAARDLFEHGRLPYIKRARAATDPALECISAIAREAAATKSRHLVVLTGVPGSGKTLVGLQLVHSHWLDALAIPRGGRRPAAPAVFLSGNGPLVAVLQHALQSAGGGGKTFVQDIKRYVAFFTGRNSRIPDEHLVVFDEAQRAHDAERVAQVHKSTVIGASEPQHLLEFMERVPGWCVLVALVGSGQAIHAGEEGGLRLWGEALEGRPCAVWAVHAAPSVAERLEAPTVSVRMHAVLSLDTEIRHHLVPRVHAWVEAVLDRADARDANALSDALHAGGFRLLLTRDLSRAQAYLRERYTDSPLARYGLIASSKDKLLPDWGVDNTYQTTKQLRVGPWFNAAAGDAQSCCQFSQVGTEFAVQGLELDMTLLAWGSDFRRDRGRWSMDLSRGTRGRVRDPIGLRRNSYRVLLTRGRDGAVVFVPPTGPLEETARFLLECGVRSLDGAVVG